ncbi:MAG: aldo/keto reductase, partial [Bacteroidales bacterium]|nr:aldo/keto reductase [Bacteroidales bacterium]
MPYIKLGNSDLEVSEICFGAWAIGGWLWGGTDEAAALRALDAAIDTGVTSIDTAAAYGFGLSEEIVGKAIQGKRDKVQIMTKYGLRWDDTRGDFYFATKLNDGTPVNIHSYAG